MNANGYCPVELVMLGTFPNARYFSVTDNDMQYAATQHVADFAMDPAEPRTGGYTNPFLPGTNYKPSQAYIVPVIGVGSVGAAGEAVQHRLLAGWFQLVHCALARCAAIVGGPVKVAAPSTVTPA